jgi:hypothetical protein
MLLANHWAVAKLWGMVVVTARVCVGGFPSSLGHLGSLVEPVMDIFIVATWQ